MFLGQWGPLTLLFIENKYFLRARSLGKEGVQITVPISGSLKVSIYDSPLFDAELADYKGYAVWDAESLPYCYSNASGKVEGV